MTEDLEEVDDKLVFMMSVDGTHCPIWEPKPFDTKWSSFKRGGSAGVNYELGILIHMPVLAWVHGPEPPGKKNDAMIFKEKLMHSLPPGKKVIADGIYAEEELRPYCSTKSDFDPPEISDFKNRVLARHETFNGLCKNFAILSTPFRHGVENHRVHFDAVCAINMFRLNVTCEIKLLDPYP